MDVHIVFLRLGIQWHVGLFNCPLSNWLQSGAKDSQSLLSAEP